jgi:hypothetical protein
MSTPATLPVPLALIDWAQRDTSVREFAEELLALGERSGDDVEVSTASAWSRLWCCVEACVYAAVGAGRADLLTDLPVWVAKSLGLRFSWHSADGTCYELGGDGRGRATSWGGAEAILGWSQGDPAALEAVRDTMDVLGAKPMRLVEDRPCSKCGKTSVVSVDTIDDVRYCAACWSHLTAPATVRVPPKPATRSRSTTRRR